MPIRIQIAIQNKLVAEAVVENNAEADKLWAKWCCVRYRKGLYFGGALINREDIRHWDVEIGEVIR
jgi:hypothetical protein